MKRFLKISILLPAVMLLLALAIFGGWYLQPIRPLDIVVLDKTVPASPTGTGRSLIDYRKHYGLFWMLEQQRYRKPKLNKAYDYRTDYYGSVLDKTGAVQNKSMAQLERTPDMVYLADTFGSQKPEQSTAVESGLSYEDIAAASTVHINGSTLIAEADVFSSTEDSVRQEVESTFSLTYSTWTGRYITDMSDLTDVPEWAQSLHETQYGRKWDYSGAGILLASDKGELVVLEQGKDFNQSMLTVSITEKFESEFGRHSTNYYNWFVIVDAGYSAESVAEFHLDLNESGQKKFGRVSDSSSFPAVLRTKGSKAPSYFFAGDFNDYVAQNRFSRFLFSDVFYRFFSYDRPGDITNFYWNFYCPLMNTILRQTEKNKTAVVQPASNNSTSFRIQNNKFEVQENGTWTPFVIKGFNINAVMAGSQPYDYTRDIAVYQKFISEISAMGGNCIRVYDLLPPEFYRALYEYNQENPDSKVYFLQSIVTPDNITAKDALASKPQTELRHNVEYVIDAVHGKAKVPAVGSRKGGVYIQDVSSYLAGYLIETEASAQTVASLQAANPGYTYSGEYLSSRNGATEGLVAILGDYAFSYQQKNYGFISPVGAVGNAALAPSLPWSITGGVSFNPDSLTATDKTGGSFFVSFSVQPNDNALLDNAPTFASYNDSDGSFPYGGYLRTFLQTQKNHPVLIDRFGLSTNTNAFDKETALNGLSEAKQGEGIVRMLRAIQNEGCLGGLISDYNDNWSVCSDEFSPYVLPLKDNPLWQNTLDPAQNSGVTAMGPAPSGSIGMSVKDTERMREMQVSSDAAYVYLTVLFDIEINYDKEQLIIGLDTYQRNNGEYLYDPTYFATSLSGMEYVIKFESKNTAAIYVVPSYNREKGQYASKESYKGVFDYICQLTYGSFETTGSNFYQSGASIHIRIPWNLLNFTNPSKRLVINDTRSAADIAKDAFGIQTTNTNGILFSLLIADKQTKDSLYIFPLSKQASGYKTFTWDPWTSVKYFLRQKESCQVLSRYFKSP